MVYVKLDELQVGGGRRVVVALQLGEELGGPVDHGPVAQWVDAT